MYFRFVCADPSRNFYHLGNLAEDKMLVTRKVAPSPKFPTNFMSFLLGFISFSHQTSSPSYFPSHSNELHWGHRPKNQLHRLVMRVSQGPWPSGHLLLPKTLQG